MHPSSLTTFVSNRVAEIQEWSDQISWRHVPTKQNPADIVSRGFSLLRVGGRLLNASLPYDAKFPLLLPKQNNFVTLYL